MRVPSGDQRGDESPAVPVVSGRCSVPSKLTIQRLETRRSSFTVGRDLRIRSYLDTENVHGLQAIGDFLSIDGQRGKHEECS